MSLRQRVVVYVEGDDGLRSHFFRVDAPHGLPRTWHVVTGNDGDAELVFECRFDAAPEPWPVQGVFRSVGRKSSQLDERDPARL